MLIIDDDLTVCKEIKYAMQNETTDVYYATSAKDALENLYKLPFCLIIMDTHLLDINGLDLLRTIRSLKTIPVLVLSSKVKSTDKVDALHAGASSYMNKPYKLEECLAHAQSLIRLYTDLHPHQSRYYTLVFGIDLVIDPTQHRVTLKGQPLTLTRMEFDLLFCLANHAGQVLSREQLYRFVWNESNHFDVDELVKAHIKTLRKKLTSTGREYIKNV